MRRFLSPEGEAAGGTPAALPPAYGELVKRLDAMQKELADLKGAGTDGKRVEALEKKCADLDAKIEAKREQLEEQVEEEAEEPKPRPKPRAKPEQKSTANDMHW